MSSHCRPITVGVTLGYYYLFTSKYTVTGIKP